MRLVVVWVGVLLAVVLVGAELVNEEACWLETWQRDQPYVVNSMLAVFSLLSAPETLQARYELFHTAYVDGGRITIVDQPLIPGQNVTELLQVAKAVKEAYEKGLLTYVANETGVYTYFNGTLAMAIKMAEGEEWNVEFGAWTSRQLSGGTWFNYTTVEIKVNETVSISSADLRKIYKREPQAVCAYPRPDGRRRLLAGFHMG